VVFIVGVFRIVGGFISPRELEVEGEEGVGSVVDRSRLDEFFSGVGFSCWGIVRGINGDGIAGRERDALGVVIVSDCNDSEDCEMSARSKSAGGAVLRRSSSDSVPRFEATRLAGVVEVVIVRELTALN
jgi:hypothetical protein